jgi:DNA-binding NarL/FixJ family response regulator
MAVSFSVSESAGTVRIVIVDDHEMVAEGFARIVEAEDDLELAGIASSVEEALTLVGSVRPDVVLMDFNLPDGDGVTATERIIEGWPGTRVVLLSGSGGNELLARAIAAGCSGLLAKDRPARDIVAAVRAAARGESVVRPDELAGLLDRLRNPTIDPQALTARELEVLRLLAKGRSTDAIASELYVSPHTVRNHVSNILAKLGAHSKLEAVAIATRDGTIAIQDIG